LKKNPIKILLIEDQTLVRIGLQTVLSRQFEIVGEAETSEKGFGLFKKLRPDVTLISLRLKETCAIDDVKTFLDYAPKAKIIILASRAGDGEISKALKQGALGYVLKDISPKELIKAIQTVASGKKYIPGEIAEILSEYHGQENLTKSEQKILQMIADGKSNKEIAYALEITENTVKTHVQNLFDKLGVSDRTSAVTSAIKRGLVRIDL
jgi:DNA-binding NarL/FixJ family response regulator